MTITDQIKILNKKNIQNKAQYVLTEKLLKYLQCRLIIWININI